MKKLIYTYENYIFDLYGTLIDILTDEDSPKFWSKIAKILKGNPDEIKSDYKTQCALKSELVGDGGEIELLEVFDFLTKKYNCKLSNEDLAWAFRKASIKKERLFPNVKHNLKALKKANKGVYLVSNAQSCFTLKELKKFGLDNLFDGIIISSEVGYKKPSKEIFEIAFKKFGISKEGSLYSGNDPHDDIQGAENYGIQSHFVVHE